MFHVFGKQSEMGACQESSGDQNHVYLQLEGNNNIR